jgi:hypothetical protein
LLYLLAAASLAVTILMILNAVLGRDPRFGRTAPSRVSAADERDHRQE